MPNPAAFAPSCRRSFLGGAVRAVLLVEVAGAAWQTLLSADSPAGLVQLALADFPALDQVFGSVHVLVVATPAIYPIILTRVAANSFAAVSSRCTHSGCVVNPYSPASRALVCSCHGSQFTAQGAVLNGPAAADLPAYPVRLARPGVLEVSLPGVGFTVGAVAVDTAAGRRLRVTFPTVSGLVYEARLRAAVFQPSTPVAFSLTPDGALDRTSLVGTGADATVYVPASDGNGFLSVTRK